MKIAQIFLVSFVLIIVTPAIVFSGSVLLLERMQQGVAVRFSNEEPVKGLQFVVEASANVDLQGIEKADRVSGSDWLLDFHRLNDSTMSVVVLNVSRGYLSAGEGTLATLSLETNIALGENVVVSLTGVVVSGPQGEYVAVSFENIEWQMQRTVSFELAQNFPNPFNPSTRIGYRLDDRADVRLTIYDAAGRKVKELVNDDQSAGQYAAEWNGTNEYGQQVASGVYFSHLTVNGVAQVQRMMLVK